MVSVWWSVAGVINYNFLTAGQTITAESYFEEIDEMNRKMRQQQAEKINRRGLILFQDKTRPHDSQISLN